MTNSIAGSFLENIYYKIVGALILGLNKIRHLIIGYKTPRTFPITEFRRAIEYDIEVVNNWINYLQQYTKGNGSLDSKTILELGPGADLGVGLYILYKGASKYNALDINDLVHDVPKELYEKFFARISQSEENSRSKLDYLKEQLCMTLEGKNDKLNYVCRNDFSLLCFEPNSIDLVFSQAAFEHFECMERTIKEMTLVTKTGGVLIAEVDLKTHTRWIREKDPLNIYRFSDSFYNVCKFPGSPNRIRPYQYEQMLKKNGWVNIQILPKRVLDEGYLDKVINSLNKNFRNPINQMEYLSIILCATKG